MRSVRWWKKRPSWLKGGLLTVGYIAVFHVIFMIIDLITEFISPCQDCFFRTPFGYTAFFILLVPTVLIKLMISPLLIIFPTALIEPIFSALDTSPLLGILALPFNLLFYFLIGAFIGWIDEKVKKNKEN